MHEMAVWNAFDNEIVEEYLNYEKSSKKKRKKVMTVSEFVRRRAK